MTAAPPPSPSPQDAPAPTAPLPGYQSWPHPAPQTATTAAPAVQRRVIPAPTGPNWPLVGVGLLLVVASVALVGYLLGYPSADLAAWGPKTVSVAGAALVAVGVVGLLMRRRR
ncbi:MAG: hypothetical protein V9F82_14300 [Dermatophilaceae bacterium]